MQLPDAVTRILTFIEAHIAWFWIAPVLCFGAALALAVIAYSRSR